MQIALINTNRVRPPIAPIGLDYVAEALHAAGHSVKLLDLSWEENAESSISLFLNQSNFGMVGMTLRNTDDCSFANCQSFLPGFIDLVQTVRASTGAPIVVGGVGFSVMPERILSLSNADFGVWGEGEFAVAELANRLERSSEWRDRSSCRAHKAARRRANNGERPERSKVVKAMPARSLAPGGRCDMTCASSLRQYERAMMYW